MNPVQAAPTARLLDKTDPPPVWTTGEGGRSGFLLICDHAGQSIPQQLTGLGLGTADLQRHITCDIGIEGLGRQLALQLDACCIGQHYSRLVIDCNRRLDDDESILDHSDGTLIPGNQSLTAQQRRQRQDEIFAPYHAAIAGQIASRQTRGQATWLVLLHSFTPVWNGIARPWQIGVLHHRDKRLAQALLDELQRASAADSRWVVGDNQPYTATDGSDYALQVYGEQLGLLHVEIEVRQDLISDEAGQTQWAARLAEALIRARAALEPDL